VPACRSTGAFDAGLRPSSLLLDADALEELRSLQDRGGGVPVEDESKASACRCWRRRSRRRRSWSKADARGELADEDEASGGWR
jgi:hypothetical protein